MSSMLVFPGRSPVLVGLLLRRRHGVIVTAAVALLSYAAAISGGVLLLRGDPSTTAGIAVALVVALPAVTFLVVGPLKALARDGIERQLLWRSTCFAFLVTMALALTHGLLEVLAGLPALSAWAPYAAGMAAWGVAALVLQRGY